MHNLQNHVCLTICLLFQLQLEIQNLTLNNWFRSISSKIMISFQLQLQKEKRNPASTSNIHFSVNQKLSRRSLISQCQQEILSNKTQIHTPILKSEIYPGFFHNQASKTRSSTKNSIQMSKTQKGYNQTHRRLCMQDRPVGCSKELTIQTMISPKLSTITTN